MSPAAESPSATAPRSARRRRVRWIVGIAVGVVLVVALVVLTVGGFASGAQRAGDDGVAPFVVVNGSSVPYDGPQRWTQAAVASPRSKQLTVYATGWTDRGGGPCGPPVLRFRVTETATTIAVLVADYQAPSSLATACSAVGYIPGPHTVRLRAAVGGRAVLDASTGKPVQVLDGADHPDLPLVPSGLVARPLDRWEPSGPVSRDWVARGGDGSAAITLIDQSPASVRVSGPYGRVVRQTDVRGTPATVYKGVGAAPGTWFVQWTPNDRQTITLRVATAGGHRWSASSVLALARTVDGYRTEATGRLGTPSVRGTLAATYSSADGPLQGAENMFKSSGVFVAVDCRGTGTLRVTIREATRSIRCSAGTTHHEFRSVGPPNDPFTVSVDGPSDVRWALSLARQSLDGS